MNVVGFSSKQCLGSANIEQKVVDDAVSYFTKGISQIESNLQEPHKIIKNEIPAYLSKIQKREDRFYIELVYTISHLNSSNPMENLLLQLYKKVENLNVVGKLIDVRFEKGCHGAKQDYWHVDFRENESINVLGLSYSNVPDWSTKILNNEAGLEARIFGGGTAIHNGPAYESCDQKSEASELGVIYNFNEVWHRSPRRKDFENHVEENKYRLFIKFNDRVMD